MCQSDVMVRKLIIYTKLTNQSWNKNIYAMYICVKVYILNIHFVFFFIYCFVSKVLWYLLRGAACQFRDILSEISFWEQARCRYTYRSYNSIFKNGLYFNTLLIHYKFRAYIEAKRDWLTQLQFQVKVVHCRLNQTRHMHHNLIAPKHTDASVCFNRRITYRRFSADRFSIRFRLRQRRWVRIEVGHLTRRAVECCVEGHIAKLVWGVP